MTTIQITYGDGTTATWHVQTGDQVTADIERMLGTPAQGHAKTGGLDG